VLVFALDLQQVEEVCAGGVDFDEVFVWCGRGGWEVVDFEVERALETCYSWFMIDGDGDGGYLDVFGELDGTHGCNCRALTWNWLQFSRIFLT
jgi:hypothetical protein